MSFCLTQRKIVRTLEKLSHLNALFHLVFHFNLIFESFICSLSIHILFVSLVTEHRQHRSSRNGIISETFANACCISMYLGSTKLCDSSRNTNCSSDLCVISDQQTTTLLAVHPLCVVSYHE